MPRKSPLEIVKANLRRAEDDNRNMAQVLVTARTERDAARSDAKEYKMILELRDHEIREIRNKFHDLEMLTARLEGYIDRVREMDGGMIEPATERDGLIDQIRKAVTEAG